MVMEDNESCGSRVVESSPANSRQQRRKLEVYNEVLRRLKESNLQEAKEPGFDDELWAHFDRLPTRYALDVNVERAEDVLAHKRLLQLAHDPVNRPAFEIRLVQVPPVSDGNAADSNRSSSPRNEVAQSIHPPPAFGSSPNLEALALEANKSQGQDGDSAVSRLQYSRSMHEITFSTDDKPKLLSQLTALLAEVGLNIQEAHAFSTVDGYSLDVFVVDGWPYEEIEQLRTALKKELLKIEKPSWPNNLLLSPVGDQEQTVIKHEPDHLTIPNDGTDVWEIDPQLLKFESKIASGSYGDLYKGTYCSQEVAIKVLKSERVNSDLQKEFAQEVFIMRKVRHKNVVQFIGACTKLPSLCIVTEFMSGGSVYDYLHKQKGTFKLPSLLRVAIDISKGMNYLHQNNIIHRDLKAANLLMDENEVVKVADFGVARVKAQTGVMTAETGTYRWMAPEVAVLLLTEITPKNIAVHNATEVARFVVRPVAWLSLILYPVGRVVTYLSMGMLKMLGLKGRSEPYVTEDELKLMLRGAELSGTIEEEEQDMIENVLEIKDTYVREVMTPLVDVVAIDASATLVDFHNLWVTHQYSRVPVFEERVDNIVGIAYAMDLLYYGQKGELLECSVVGDMAHKPAYFVPDSNPRRCG